MGTPKGIFLPVHLTPDDREQCLAVYEDSYTILLDDLVELSWLVDVFEMVGQAGATLVTDTYADELGGWSLQKCS